MKPVRFSRVYYNVEHKECWNASELVISSLAFSDPLILDWVSVGLINPILELVDTALAWSRERDEAPAQTRFQALIAGYCRAGGQPQGGNDDAVMGVLGRWLERLEVRPLDEAPAPLR